jgi:hypothetical protein
VARVQEDVVVQQTIAIEVQQTNDVILVWSKKDKALTILIMAIKDNLIPIMGDLLEPIEVW